MGEEFSDITIVVVYTDQGSDQCKILRHNFWIISQSNINAVSQLVKEHALGSCFTVDTRNQHTSELHRDDVTDIEDFDYVQFQYGIDQISLKETLAVATMLGDDRPDSDPEKIFPDKIRPIWTDDELYTIHKDVDFAAMAKELQGSNTEQYFGESFIYAEAMVTALRKARKDFRGTGNYISDWYTFIVNAK